MTPQQRIARRLRALSPTDLVARDDSHLHVGHREAKNGAHLSLRVVSARFAGLSPLARHRLVYQTIGDLAAIGVHALSVSAVAPGEDAAMTKEKP